MTNPISLPFSYMYIYIYIYIYICVSIVVAVPCKVQLCSLLFTDGTDVVLLCFLCVVQAAEPATG
jgi:hypothetical protein